MTVTKRDVAAMAGETPAVESRVQLTDLPLEIKHLVIPGGLESTTTFKSAKK